MGCDSLAFLLLTQELYLTKKSKREEKKKEKKYPSSCNTLHISAFIIWFLITGFTRRVRMTQVKSRASQALLGFIAPGSDQEQELLYQKYLEP